MTETEAMRYNEMSRVKSEYFPLFRPPLNIHQRSLISAPSRPPPKLSEHLPIFHFWATEKKFTNTTKFATVSNFDSIFFSAVVDKALH